MAGETLRHLELLWPDGSMTRAASYEEAEVAIRAEQPRPFPSRMDFRREMAARAKAWSGAMVGTCGTSEEFLKALAGTGLFMIACDAPEAER